MAAADGYYSYVPHDWSSTREDPELRLTRRILTRVKENGMRATTYAAHYAEKTSFATVGTR